MKKYLILLTATLLSSCSSNTALKYNEVIYWIHPQQKACMGVVEQMCLQYQQDDLLHKEGAWYLFYDTIKGLKLDPGYYYKVKLKREYLPKPVAADRSTVQYSLVRVIEKVKA